MKRSMVLWVAGAALLSACGSGDKSSGQSSGSSDGASTTAAVVAGAQENAVTSAAVCYSWPNGMTDAQPCAVGLKGPGGGRVFYDAGSVQSWGRFLEVAPQNWNVRPVDCPSCGAAEGVQKWTTDTRGGLTSYFLCRDTNQRYEDQMSLSGEAGDTLWEIGGGRHNTAVLSATPECVDGSVSALTLATGYRGGGLSDWYLPSGGELTELCRYTGRNAIGGFGVVNYVSSTVGPNGGHTDVFAVDFGDAPTCTRKVPSYGTDKQDSASVRPIRAFA